MEETKRTEVYQTLPENIKRLYSSPAAAALNRQIIEMYSIPEDGVDAFLNVTGDTILGFYKTGNLPQLLQAEVGVSSDDAIRIVSDLQEFLAPVIAREKGEINPNHEELKELQTEFTPTEKAVTAPQGESPPTSSEHAPEINDQTTTEPSAVQSMRTMEGDMHRIHGYGAYRSQFPDEVQEAEHTEDLIRSASQEDILKEKPKLAEMPTYKEGEGE